MRTCPDCGAENLENFKFCGACGRALPEQTPREERKLVTCVFCDVTGSTALGESLDPEAVRRMMTRYFEEMRRVLASHGGTVEKFVGDAVMAVFGVPEVHEDDALRAVRAAIDMKAKLDELNEDLVARFGAGIKIRTGINTGEVLAGDVSQGHGFVSGDTVNLAARLEQAASPGEILLGDGTYRLVQDAVDAKPVAPLELKGKAEPVPAWRLLSVSDARYGRARQLSSVLVGRDEELSTLTNAFEESVQHSACRLVTVIGTAGVGKSRLALELIGRARERAEVLEGRCLSYGEGMTFWPVAEVIRQAAGIDENDSADAALGKLHELIDGEDRDAIARGVGSAIGLGEAAGEIQETFWGIRKLFELLAAKRPLVVVFDDIHWGEPTFLDLLEYIGNFTTSAPLTLLCLARPDLLEARPAWPNVADSVRVALEPLEPADTSALITNLLDDSSLPSDTRALIARSAEGNPLFVEELLRMLVDDGILVRADDGWAVRGDLSTIDVPPTITALLASRLDRLSDAERDVIQRAGVVGVVFWWGAVTELSPEALRPRVGSYIQELARRDLIRPDPSSFFNQDAFRFGHVLIREAAYQSMPKMLRAELHERFAEWLIRVTEGSGMELDEILGYHLEQSFSYKSELGPVSESDLLARDRAAEHLAAAGRRALDQGDMPAAAGLLRRAWTLRGADWRKIPELYLDLTIALVFSGQLEDARRVVDEAEAIAPGGDALVESYIALGALYLGQWVGTETGWAGEILDRVDDLIDTFRASEDEGALVAALILKGEAHWVANLTAQAELAWEEALTWAKGNPRREGPILNRLLQKCAWGPLPVSEALRRCDELEAMAPGLRVVQAGALVARSALSASVGRFDDARELGRALVRLETELGFRMEAAAGLGQNLGTIEMLAGDYTEAERLQRESCRALETLNEKGYLSTTEAYLAHTLCSQGRWEEAIEVSRRAEEHGDPDDVSTHHLWRNARAKAYARLGRHEEAVALAREAWALVGPGDIADQKIAALIDLAEVLFLAGERDEATARLHEALDLARHKEHKVYERRILGRLTSVEGVKR